VLTEGSHRVRHEIPAIHQSGDGQKGWRTRPSTATTVWSRSTTLAAILKRFGITTADFHAANQQRLRDWPHTMLATSTHDSKRSEDVRARIDVLSEIPGLWRLRIRGLETL